MKRFALLMTFTVCFSLIVAQVPRGFNYQAIAHDGSNNPVTSTIQVKIGFQTDTLLSTYIWEELHSTVKPNSAGLFSLVIGSGTRVSGVPTFGDIDWGKNQVYMKISIFHNSTWKYMGAAKLWSVPYSMVSGGLDGSSGKLEVVGEDVTSDEALFEVRRKDGQTMFAVYNHGVRVYMPLDTLSKAKKGGFAIGGFDKAKGTIQDYLVVNPDSIRAYVDANQGKGGKGGFAIGGFDKAKAPAEEYLRVTRDNTSIFVNTDTTGKPTKGGFAIGGFDKAKGTVVPFVDLTPLNYFIGHESGLVTTGRYNSFIGFQAGYSLTYGSSNILIGDQAGFAETGSNLLIIENSNSDTPLIYGNFGTNDFRINGNIQYTGTIGSVSDMRLKRNIVPIENAIEKLGLINGIYYEWEQSDTIGLLLQEGRQIGVIAQEVEAVYPELVITTEKGYKMVDYAKLSTVLLEGIKEQQKQINSYKSENEALQSKLQTLQERVDIIENMLIKVGGK